MKKLNLIFGFLFICSLAIFLNACVEKNSLDEPEAEVTEEASNLLLFGKIEVEENELGTYSFVENDLEKVRTILEDIYIKKQDQIKRIDEFGFDLSMDGKVVFFVKEYLDQGAKTGFTTIKNYIKDNDDALRNVPIPVTICYNVECCNSCNFNSSQTWCYCHNIDVNCDGGTGNGGSCGTKTINIPILF